MKVKGQKRLSATVNAKQELGNARASHVILHGRACPKTLDHTPQPLNPELNMCNVKDARQRKIETRLDVRLLFLLPRMRIRVEHENLSVSIKAHHMYMVRSLTVVAGGNSAAGSGRISGTRTSGIATPGCYILPALRIRHAGRAIKRAARRLVSRQVAALLVSDRAVQFCSRAFADTIRADTAGLDPARGIRRLRRAWSRIHGVRIEDSRPRLHNRVFRFSGSRISVLGTRHEAQGRVQGTEMRHCQSRHQSSLWP